MRSDWHPGMLARMNAWDAQIAFFNKYGDEELLVDAVRRYCKIGKEEYLAIERSSAISVPEKKKYQAIIRRKFRHILVRNKEEVKKTRYYKWFDKTAYSEYRKFKQSITEKLDWCYWTVRGILGKIHRVIKRLLKKQ